MKQLDSWDIRTIRHTTSKVVYNMLNEVYTLTNSMGSVAQFDTKTNICVVKANGFFNHFTHAQLDQILSVIETPIILIGGRRARNDNKRKFRNYKSTWSK